MPHRALIVALLLGCSSLAPRASGAAVGPVRAEPPPGIVLFLVDDLGWKDLGCYGNTFHDTPRIDRLATQGMLFTDAYANAPNCAPSRASLMTGCYPPRHGVYTVAPAARGQVGNRKLLVPETRQTLRDEAWTLAEALSGAGYRCASIGKWHLGSTPLSQGFEKNAGGNQRGHPKSYFSPYDNPELPDGPEGEHLTARLTDEAVKFLDEVGEEPFFLYLPYFAVHTPIQAREELARKYCERKSESDAKDEPLPKPKYAAMVEAVDQSVGRVLDALDERGLAENTIVILFSDNGGHGKQTSNLPLRGSKGMLYEGGIREPLIVRWPGRVEAGRRSAEVVLGMDFFPTLLELAGARIPEERVIDGVSLVPLLTGRGALRREEVFWHFPAYLEAYDKSDGPWRTTPASAIRAGRYKLIEFFEDGRLELYDLETDLAEAENLAESLPEVRDDLHRRLKRWRQETNAPVPDQPNPKYDPNR